MQRGAGMFLLTALAATAASASLEQGGPNPVTRVVELLQGLSKDVAKEAKTEESLFEDFKCWAKTVLSSKTATNAQAQTRIDQLKTYIADLDAGRVELTSERSDLEKEIEQLSGEIEVATEARKKEASDFEDARSDMDKAIAALTNAVEVLRVATAGHEEGNLLAIRSQLQQGAESHAAEASSLAHAADLGDRFLTKGDAAFLRRLLTGEVPEADWQKLDRTATFKLSYQARSFKIQGVLAKLLETFATNLQEATKKENEAKALFDTLLAAKTSQKESAQTALSKLASESGSKGLSKAESEEEVASLQKQVDDDSRYIDEVQQSLEEKTAEWKERSEIRTSELAALSKGIAILHSDDARDLFKKSYTSQGYSLLQLSTGSSAEVARGAAVEALRAAARISHDSRLRALASLASAGHFDEVIKAVDTMISVLDTEEATDLKYKEDCEGNRQNDARSAILAGRAVDELSDTVTSLEAEVAELTRQIKVNKDEVAQVVAELDQGKKIRDQEHANYLVAKQQDEDAAALVKRATEVISAFYEDAAFLQRQRQPEVKAAIASGAAPPPPPSTWEAPYGGKQHESDGIVAILEMVHDDIQEDLAKSQAAEEKAQAAYDAQVISLNREKDDLNALISTLSGTQGEKLEKAEEAKGSRRTKKGELDAVLGRLKAVESGCDFFVVNYPVRLQNRRVELDGLLKAKAILQGATFTAPEDPSRVLKPGDALVQRSLRRHA